MRFSALLPPTKNDFRLTGDKIPFLPGQKKDFPFRKRRTERTPFPENRQGLSLIPTVIRRKIQSVHFQRSLTGNHVDKLACRENLDWGSQSLQSRYREVRYARYLVSGFDHGRFLDENRKFAEFSSRHNHAMLKRAPSTLCSTLLIPPEEFSILYRERKTPVFHVSRFPVQKFSLPISRE